MGGVRLSLLDRLRLLHHFLLIEINKYFSILAEPAIIFQPKLINTVTNFLLRLGYYLLPFLDDCGHLAVDSLSLAQTSAHIGNVPQGRIHLIVDPLGQHQAVIRLFLIVPVNIAAQKMAAIRLGECSHMGCHRLGQR